MLKKYAVLAGLLVSLFCFNASAAVCERVKTWGSEVLTYTDLNAEFDRLITCVNNIDPSKIDLTGNYNWTGTHTFPTANATTVVATTVNGSTGNFNDGHMYGQPLYFSKEIVLPEYVQLETDALPIMPVEAGWAPNGILITKFGIKTSASSTYSVVIEDWTSPTSGSSVDISTVATSTSTEAESGALTTTVSAGHIVFIDLPTTTGLKWIQVWFVYEIKA